MTAEQQCAYERAKEQRYPSTAAQYTKILVSAIDFLTAENAQLRAVITESKPDFFKRKCRVCGCDWNHPCNDHDYWVEDDLCSACAEK